jgi:DNA-binding transcriptional LysR family regulator
MRFTLKQLQVYLATAHTENLSLAAEKLALSQSAASDALKTLEHLAGIKLFDRIGKRLQLNEMGREIRPLVERLLEQAEELDHAMHRTSVSGGGLTLGATLSIGNYIGIKMLAAYRQQHPDNQVKLEVANTATIVEKVLNYDIDHGLIEGEVNHPDLIIEPWLQDELVIFCAPHDPLIGKLLTDEDLVKAPWILREQGSGTRQAFEFSLRGLMPRLTVNLELQHTEAIKRAVEAGMGLGCLSRITLEDAFRRGTLVPLDAPGRDFHRTLYTILHKAKYITPGVQAWIDLCASFRSSVTTHPVTPNHPENRG